MAADFTWGLSFMRQVQKHSREAGCPFQETTRKNQPNDFCLHLTAWNWGTGQGKQGNVIFLEGMLPLPIKSVVIEAEGY